MKRVVVVGCGFGGLQVIHKLANRKEFEVVVIDRTNHHLFQPLLYQVATAVLSPADIAIPSRSLTTNYSNVKVVMAELTGVDWEKKQVSFEGQSLSYDYLILAMGASSSFFGNDSWRKFATPLKNLNDALEIRKKILLSLEKAEIEPDPNIAKQYLSYVIVGGGPTGVELAGSIAELTHTIMRKDFRNIDPETAKVTLVEAGPRLLPSFFESLSAFTKLQLEKRGVRVLLGTAVQKIDEVGVHLKEESIPCKNIIWAAGVQGLPVFKNLGVALDKSGRVVVDEFCKIPNTSGAFAIGDMTNFSKGLDRPLPGVSPVAMQQGRYVCDVIFQEMKQKPIKPFQYFDKGSMATIGRNDAVAQVGNLKMKGFLGWIAWLFVHLFYQVGFKNKVSILLTWLWSYVTFRAGARLIYSNSGKED